MIRRAMALLSIVFLAVVSVAVADEYIDVEHELSMEFVTPHTKWARPYAGGRIRAIFFHAIPGGSPSCPGGESAREIIELMQRFDIDSHAAYWNNGKWLRGEEGEQRILRLLKDTYNYRPLKPYDVYVFTVVSPDALSEEAREIVYEAVRTGAGIVLVGTGAGGLLGNENRLEPPTFLPAGECYRVGEGRAVTIPGRGEVPYRVGWDVELEYQFERWGRALLWAAGREPEMTLDVEPAGGKIARADLPGQVATVRWTRALPGTQVAVSLRRWDGETTHIASQECSPADGHLPLGIPVLRAGRYHIDAIARSGRGIESWANASFTVMASRTVNSVALDRNWGEIGEDLSGRAQLGGAATGDEKVRVRLMDRRGRSLAQQDLDVEGQSVPFRFRIEPWMPMLLRVEAVVMRGDEEVSSAYAFSRVTKRQRKDFNFIMWESPRTDLGPHVLDRLEQLGVSALLFDRNPSLAMAAYEMAHIPYATRILPGLDENGIMIFEDVKGVCYNDDARAQEIVDRRTARFRPAREHGVLVYSLGDEGAMSGACLSPHCLRAYREYLEAEYGGIEALNASWGTGFTGFDEVELSAIGEMPAEDAPAWFKEYYEERRMSIKHGAGNRPIPTHVDRNDEVSALQAGNFARWYDRQAFLCYNVVQIYKRYRHTFKQMDPEALTGFEGTGNYAIQKHPSSTQDGGDIELVMRELDWYGPYGDVGNELIRSITRPGFLRGNWLGYHKDPAHLLGRYWGMITNGFNIVQWWKWDNVGRWHGFVRPDLGLYPETVALAEACQVVHNGLGALLANSDMEDDGVALLRSLPSTYIIHMDGNRTYGDDEGPKNNNFSMWQQYAWQGRIQRAGLQYRYVTDRMMRRGAFDASRYKALILPFALAIGDEEADVIREFVRGGGTLIADVRPGTYTGHCKPRDQGVLDDVFGIERDGKRDAVTARLEVAGELAGRPLALRSWNVSKVDPAVRVTTGRALGRAGDVPVCIVNEFGRGRAVLLNFPMVDVSDASLHDTAADPLIKDLLATAGVEPQVVLDRPAGEQGADVSMKAIQWMLGHMAGVEITRWKNGKIELVSLLGSYDGEIGVALPEERHVYDVTRGIALGEVKSFRTELRPSRAAFFALLPKAAPAVKVAMPTNVARGTVVKAKMSVPRAAGKHAVRVRVTAPGGKPAEWLNRVVVTGKKAVEVDLPFAYNDPEGTWTVSAIDLYTNKATTVHVVVD